MLHQRNVLETVSCEISSVLHEMLLQVEEIGEHILVETDVDMPRFLVKPHDMEVPDQNIFWTPIYFALDPHAYISKPLEHRLDIHVGGLLVPVEESLELGTAERIDPAGLVVRSDH